ncbi:MAG TPA: hypothetical protein VNA89_08545 [Gemmatimonadaceae bacterium]|nr:hypothetical protein [Gemmatimonadaceae bacterium]
MSALRTLLAGAIDYAGLFPPAQLSMAEAVANYAAYRASADAWALGRFVVPAARLAELAEAAGPHQAPPPWRISALATLPADAEMIARFNQRQAGRALVDAVETRAISVEQVAAAGAAPAGVTVYVEIPVDGDVDALLDAIREARARAKVRTGGVTPDAFPPAEALARFIAACARHGVRFKATAGLHHPLRAEHALTYEPGSALTTMHGYLNVMTASAFAVAGTDEPTLAAVLGERDFGAFDLAGDSVRWRGRTIDATAVADARGRLVDGFGSCSFREPLDELSSLAAAAWPEC